MNTEIIAIIFQVTSSILSLAAIVVALLISSRQGRQLENIRKDAAVQAQKIIIDELEVYEDLLKQIFAKDGNQFKVLQDAEDQELWDILDRPMLAVNKGARYIDLVINASEQMADGFNSMDFAALESVIASGSFYDIESAEFRKDLLKIKQDFKLRSMDWSQTASIEKLVTSKRFLTGFNKSAKKMIDVHSELKKFIQSNKK